MAGATRGLAECHSAELQSRDEQIAGLRAAVEALEQRRAEPNPPPGIGDALRALAETGDTAAAEGIFQQVLAAKEAEGAEALAEAGCPPG